MDLQFLKETIAQSHPGPWFARNGEIRVDEEGPVDADPNEDMESVDYGKRIGRFLGDEGVYSAQLACLAVNMVYEFHEEAASASNMAAESRSAASELADVVEAVARSTQDFEAADKLEAAVKAWENRIRSTGIRVLKK